VEDVEAADRQMQRCPEMGHGWPGGEVDDPMAAPDAPISASELLWQFFEQHRGRR